MEPKNDIFDHIKVRKTETPDAAYFENLANQVIASQKQENKIISLYKKPIFWMTAAAASVVVVLLLNLGNNDNEQQNVLLALNEISAEAIQTYIDDNIDDFDADLITEFIDEKELKNETMLPEQEITPEINTSNDIIELKDVEEEEILKYLEDEELDIYELFDDESFI